MPVERSPSKILTLSLAALALLAFGCGEADRNVEPVLDLDSNSEANEKAERLRDSGALPPVLPSDRPKELFFGDLHVHSAWSFDAFASGVSVGPGYAYRYARGEAIPHYSGQEIQLEGPPLDFIAVTDHAEYLGLSNALVSPEHPLSSQPIVEAWRGDNPQLGRLAWKKIQKSYSSRNALPALEADAVVVPTWRALIQIANREYRPGNFTTFIGFEYTANPEGQNLHRNVIFRGDEGPRRPFSAMASENPEDLWDWMDRVRSRHGDLIAIPHNANGSNGLMFATTRSDGAPIDVNWAEQRARNEPVAETFQIKGQSETHPVLSPGDEWSNFEIFDRRTTRPSLSSQPPGSYVRDALKRGLEIEVGVGRNPYALGMIGSTDGHNASSPFEERNFTGKIGSTDANPQDRLAWLIPKDRNREPVISVATQWGAAGLAGIWAEENTREALFDALRRRETFATSGPRIRVRLFAGWDLTPADLEGDVARGGSSRGVAMGGILEAPADAQDSKAGPTFLVAAQKDPIEAGLERVQIVKGWLVEGEAHERVFDIACASGAPPDEKTHRCPDRKTEPDLESCAPASNSGAAELASTWQDPEYTPLASAFYYVRVLQIPTCRWSTFDANRLGQPLHSGVPPTIQERAVTSPIWIP